MGNVMQNEDSKGGVHGVLYRISNLDMARLTHMEHEYRQVLQVAPALPLLLHEAAVGTTSRNSLELLFGDLITLIVGFTGLLGTVWARGTAMS